LSTQACSDAATAATSQTTYLAVVNTNNDYSKAKNLREAQEWAAAEGDAAFTFRQELKHLEFEGASVEVANLADVLKQKETNATLRFGADSWAQFNPLITLANLLSNDYNDAKNDLFQALDDGCAH